jgi:hypothetical protein
MSLLYYTFMDKASQSPAVKHAGCTTVVVGILAQSGGFFIHMVKRQPNRASIGTTVTTIGAISVDLRYRRTGLWLVYGALTGPSGSRTVVALGHAEK